MTTPKRPVAENSSDAERTHSNWALSALCNDCFPSEKEKRWNNSSSHKAPFLFKSRDIVEPELNFHTGSSLSQQDSAVREGVRESTGSPEALSGYGSRELSRSAFGEHSGSCRESEVTSSIFYYKSAQEPGRNSQGLLTLEVSSVYQEPNSDGS